MCELFLHVARVLGARFLDVGPCLRRLRVKETKVVFLARSLGVLTNLAGMNSGEGGAEAALSSCDCLPSVRVSAGALIVSSAGGAVGGACISGASTDGETISVVDAPVCGQGGGVTVEPGGWAFARRFCLLLPRRRRPLAAFLVSLAGESVDVSPSDLSMPT